jgi:hypothetical protein
VKPEQDGVFAIPLAENDRLKRLYEKYGLADTEIADRADASPVDIGDNGECPDRS